jgi:hypothetical protein
MQGIIEVLNDIFFLKETDHFEDLGMYWKITLMDLKEIELDSSGLEYGQVIDFVNMVMNLWVL